MAGRRNFLRVATGELGGRRIQVPPGVRPTTDRVRAAIFDALQQEPSARVLDLFAGSGSFGIEAFSRGAEFVQFIERNRRAAQVIEDNLKSLKIYTQADIVIRDVLRTDLRGSGPFGLVFADPPYADNPWAGVFKVITVSGVLSKDARIVVEVSSRQGVPDPPDGWMCWKVRRHGDTEFAIFVHA